VPEFAMTVRALLFIALSCPALSACTAAATAALEIAGTIAVKAIDLDTAIIADIKARRDAAADPNMRGGLFDPRAAAARQPGGARIDGSGR